MSYVSRFPRAKSAGVGFASAKKADGLELVVEEHTFIDVYTWTHGDIIVTTEDNARKFSAALKSRGLSKAPPGHWLVRALHRELFASDREKAIAERKMPGLEVELSSRQSHNSGHKYTWRHGEIEINSETTARKFSEALQRRELLEARAGDPRVQSTVRKSKFHGRIFAEVRPSFLVSTGQESVRRGRHRATPRQQRGERFDSHLQIAL